MYCQAGKKNKCTVGKAIAMSHDSDIEVEYFSKTHCEKNMIETIRNELVDRCNSEQSFFLQFIFSNNVVQYLLFHFFSSPLREFTCNWYIYCNLSPILWTRWQRIFSEITAKRTPKTNQIILTTLAVFSLKSTPFCNLGPIGNCDRGLLHGKTASKMKLSHITKIYILKPVP